MVGEKMSIYYSCKGSKLNDILLNYILHRSYLHIVLLSFPCFVVISTTSMERFGKRATTVAVRQSSSHANKVCAKSVAMLRWQWFWINNFDLSVYSLHYFNLFILHPFLVRTKKLTKYSQQMYKYLSALHLNEAKAGWPQRTFQTKNYSLS